MKYGVYTVKDRLVGYNSPVLFQNEDIAKRAFVNSVKKNPCKDDLELFRIAYFEDETGLLENGLPDLIIKGTEVVDI